MEQAKLVLLNYGAVGAFCIIFCVCIVFLWRDQKATRKEFDINYAEMQKEFMAKMEKMQSQLDEVRAHDAEREARSTKAIEMVSESLTHFSDVFKPLRDALPALLAMHNK